MRIPSRLFFVAIAVFASLSASDVYGVSLGLGDAIKLDWSTAGDADGPLSELDDWNQTDDGQVDFAAGSVIRHGDGATLDGVTISFLNARPGRFNNDPLSDDPVFLANDPYFVQGADDIYFHGLAANLMTTFGGLNTNYNYEVRIYNSLNRNPSNLFTNHIVNGQESGFIGEYEAWSANTLEEAGLVFNVSPTLSGEIVIELDPQGTTAYPLQAMVIIAVQRAFELEVNTVTGNVTLANISGEDLNFKGYHITSAGSLNPNGWNSLQDQGLADQDNPGGNSIADDGIGWEVLGDPNGTSSSVAEFNLQSSTILGPGGINSIALGSLFTPSATEDLVAELTFDDGTRNYALVSYVSTPVALGDYNGDGIVDSADYTVWRDNQGGNADTAFATGSRDPGASGPIDSDDYQFWKSNFGSPGAGAQAGLTAVPEPSALVLGGMSVVLIGLIRNRSSMQRGLGFRLLLAAPLLSALLIPTMSFARGVDRNYTFGDDDNDAGTPTANAPVGSTTSNGTTFDAMGSGPGEFVDLTPSGDPRYATVSRPLGGAGLGIEFTASTSDYLFGERLGQPDTSFSAAGGPNPGPLDYAGLTNRGFQLWVKPAASGLNNATAQSIVADTLRHGVGISANDTWTLRYNNNVIDSGMPVTSDQWYHVMVVRPSGSSGQNSGSRLYVDGIAIAAAGGGYSGGDNTPLVVGANSGATPGTAEFFSGTLDDLEMFVLGTTTSDPPTVYGEFNFVVDNEFAASVLPGYVPGDTNGDGMVMGDGTLAPGGIDDVSTFIANYRVTQLVNNVRAGDIYSPTFGDFNFDGITDIADWALLRSNHSAPGALNLAALLSGKHAVPEPSALAILAGGMAIFWCGKRKQLKVARIALVLTIGFGVGFMGQQAGAEAISNQSVAANASFEGAPFAYGTMLFNLLVFAILTLPALLVCSLRRSKVMPRLSVVPLAFLCCLAFQASAWAADLWNIDIQGNAGSTTFGQSGTVVTQPNDASGVWNAFEVESVVNTGGGPFYTTNPSLNLVDNDGNASGVTFGLTGQYAGWNGVADADPLMGDYLILLPAGTLGNWPAPPAVFDFTGLMPNTSYGIRLFSGINAGRPGNVTIDTDGDGLLTDESAALLPGNDSLVLNVTSSATGGITGIVDIPSGVGETDLSAIQLAVGSLFADDPVLEITRETGGMQFINDTENSLNVVAYEILSAAGALHPGSWTSIADSDSSWIELTTATDRDNLAEVQDPQGAGVALPNGGGAINLGTPWLQSPIEDVANVRLVLADNSVIAVDVVFTGNGDEPLDVGDFDGDGVDIDDWNLLKPLFGTDPTSGGTASLVERYRAGDLTGDGFVTLADMNAFAVSFDAANGAGAFATLVNGATVPEPASVFLMLAVGSVAVVWTSGLFCSCEKSVFCPHRRT